MTNRQQKLLDQIKAKELEVDGIMASIIEAEKDRDLKVQIMDIAENEVKILQKGLIEY